MHNSWDPCSKAALLSTQFTLDLWYSVGGEALKIGNCFFPFFLFHATSLSFYYDSKYCNCCSPFLLAFFRETGSMCQGKKWIYTFSAVRIRGSGYPECSNSCCQYVGNTWESGEGGEEEKICVELLPGSSTASIADNSFGRHNMGQGEGQVHFTQFMSPEIHVTYFLSLTPGAPHEAGASPGHKKQRRVIQTRIGSPWLIPLQT